MFRPKRPFTALDLNGVPPAPGVYIVYLADGTPSYVGRSIIDIRRRLIAHVHGRGSVKIRERLARGERLLFEWEELLSPHQAEAQLQKHLGVCAGNLRQETDPADW